jgi:hypothetical protein
MFFFRCTTGLEWRLPSIDDRIGTSATFFWRDLRKNNLEWRLGMQPDDQMSRLQRYLLITTTLAEVIGIGRYALATQSQSGSRCQPVAPNVVELALTAASIEAPFSSARSASPTPRRSPIPCPGTPVGPSLKHNRRPLRQTWPARDDPDRACQSAHSKRRS